MTKYHAKYYANFLTLQNPNNSVERLGNSLFNATIELNPHQIDAALFFFENPLSNGVILADEVGLGKTIEAGLVISQLRSEHKRKLLLIVPASLRKQWSSELEEKFHLPSSILDNNIWKQLEKKGIDPFQQHPQKILITSYEFVAKRSAEFALHHRDLAVIDEAHKLRNVRRTDNKRAVEIKACLQNTKKLLLTATPLQNSLLELYGLVSFIDETTFGDIESFKEQFLRDVERVNTVDLKQRLKPLIHRTLRKQVLEYINYTNRIPITENFTPADNEQKLYDLISDFLQRDELKSINNSQKQLLTLVFRKLLASSSRAITGTLDTMIARLEKSNDFSELIDDEDLSQQMMEDYEEIIPDNDENTQKMHSVLLQLKGEIDELKEFKKIAHSINVDEKTKSLMTALRTAFIKLKELGANKKAIIFTESTRTQTYLLEYLEANGYKDKILLFNGSNKSPKTKEVYTAWLARHEGTSKITGSKESDIRASLVEYFKEDDSCEILIATESAAEGVNLQFCSLLINYDLPWNPQRIEQRIGRCHRYGQKFDVLVVNFLNTKNLADQRVFQLLNEKFQLFEGVFGASDDVLGVIEDGKDFEKRILEIYQTCRTNEEIEEAFNQLQQELDDTISQRMGETKQKVLEHFDEDVARNLKMRKDQTSIKLDIFKDYFWKLTRIELAGNAQFDEERFSFLLATSPSPHIVTGCYNLVPNIENLGYTYRTNEGLGEHIINQSKERNLELASLTFDLSNCPGKIGALEPYKGKQGRLSISKVVVQSFDTEEYLLCHCIDDSGKIIDAEIAQKLFSLPGREEGIIENQTIPNELSEVKKLHITNILKDSLDKNSLYLDQAIDRLEKRADDKILSMEKQMRQLKKEISLKKNEGRKINDLQLKIQLQRDIKDLQAKEAKLRREKYDEEDKIINEKEMLLDTLEKRLQSNSQIEEIFTIKRKIK